MKKAVVDASVAVKWFLTEENQQIAFQTYEDNAVLIAPEFLKLEFDSVLSKWCRSGRLEYSIAKRIRTVFGKMNIYFVDTGELSDAGFELSSSLPVTYYDALYLCTARLYKCKMITFDKKLSSSLKGSEFEKFLTLAG